MYRDTTYLIHMGKQGKDMHLLAAFQDQDLFVTALKQLPKKTIDTCFVSCFINNLFYPSPLVDSMPVQDYIDSVI